MSDYWKEQSKQFDKAAGYYDRYRPSYPDKLIDDLIEKVPLTKESRILEIGAGSGKATELFVNRGFGVTCIEPGEELVKAGIKKFYGKDVEYYNCRFEEWEEKPGYFDFVMSAQAFHWIPQPIGYQKCANSLKKNKKLALFWNYYTSNDGQADEELKDLIAQYPIMYIDTMESIKEKIKNTVNEIANSMLFNEPAVMVYPWEQEYSTDEYLGFIRTGNGYLSLDNQKRLFIEEKVREIVGRNGGTIVRPYTCVCYLAEKK